MNILIKEFAEQAGITTNIDTDYFEKDMNKWVDYFSERFAELIVKECNRYACSAWEHGPLLGRDLLIHFGVEEMRDE